MNASLEKKHTCFQGMLTPDFFEEEVVIQRQGHAVPLLSACTAPLTILRFTRGLAK